MNKLIPLYAALFMFCSCTNVGDDTSTAGNTSQPTTTDSSAALPAGVPHSDTVTAPVVSQPAEKELPGERAGEHPISLQWIGWNKPGKATVTPVGDGWYNITGQQKTNDRNYLEIKGKIRRLGEKELEFEGTIETRIESIYGGESCIKTGKQRFFGKGTRTYFRLQNMENCEGGNLVDYIDIYPGTSNL